MYESHFGFRQKPFDLTADPRFFYENASYREALATLVYAVRERRGFAMLTGEVGTGKTTVLRRALEDLEPRVRCLLFHNTMLDFEALLGVMCDELRVPGTGDSLAARLARLTDWLVSELDAGRTVALLVDEAQQLSDDALEKIRLLSNLETPSAKLLQIVLVGQPELCTRLAQPHLRQLRQRVALRARLGPLADAAEVDAYIGHRLGAAGYRGRSIFARAAVTAIAAASQGLPRVVNVICDNALLTAFAAGVRVVPAALVGDVVRELDLAPAPSSFPSVERASTAPALVLVEPPAPVRVASMSPPVPAPVGATAMSPVAMPPAAPTAPPRRAGALPRSRWSWGAIGVAVVAGVAGIIVTVPTITRIALPPTSPVAVSAITTEADMMPPHVAPRAVSAASSAAVMTHDAERPSVSAVTPIAATPAGAAPPRLAATSAPALPSRPAPAVAQSALRLVLDDLSHLASAGRDGLVADRAGGKQYARTDSEVRGGRAVVVPRGGTLAGLVQEHYDGDHLLAMEVVLDANRFIVDVDSLDAGAKLWLPEITFDTLSRRQLNGSVRVLVGSMPDAGSARAMAAALEREGWQTSVTGRTLSPRVHLNRVEIVNLPDTAAARRAVESGRRVRMAQAGLEERPE